MNPFNCTRIPSTRLLTASLLSSLRPRPLPPTRPSAFFTRRPTATTSRLTSSFNIPCNGIIVPGPPPPSLYYQATLALSPVVRVFRAYGRAQIRRPYTIQLFTSIAIYLLGDINAQLLFGDKNTPYDPIRTLRMITIGGILSAPSYRWFLYLSDLFSPRFPKPVAVALRVMINQLCFTPVFLTAFFSLQSFLTGATAEETKERLQETLPAAYKNSCQLWPAVSAINFYWIKFEYRSVFSGVVAIGWNAYLSYLTQKRVVEEDIGLEDVVPVRVPEEQLKTRWASFGQKIEMAVGEVMAGGIAVVAPAKAVI